MTDEKLWLGHTPQGYKQHLVQTARESPINRGLVAVCGTAVKVIRRAEWDDLLTSLLCWECAETSRPQIRKELATAQKAWTSDPPV